MYCPQCGKKNVDEALFCEACGRSLTSSANQAQASTQAGVQQTVQQATQQAAVGATVASAAAAGAQAAPTFNAQKGCIGQAWSDITNSPHWVKRVLTLMLMNCVPILHFFPSGYSLQWGAQAASGNPQPLAAGVFTKKTFIFGLIIVLLDILLALGTSVFSLFSLIPILGVLLVVAINLLAAAFCYLSLLRVGVTGKLGSAFDLSELFRVYRKNLGGLFAAAIVPNLICSAIVIVAVIVLLFFAGLSGYAAYIDIDSYGHYGYGYGYNAFPAAAIGFLSGAIVLVIIAVLFALFVAGFANLWTLRAVGYWVNRTEPQWALEAAEAVKEPSVQEFAVKENLVQEAQVEQKAPIE